MTISDQRSGTAGEPVSPDLFAFRVGEHGRRSRGMLAVALALWVPLVVAMVFSVARIHHTHHAAAEERLQRSAYNVALAVDTALRAEVQSLSALGRTLPVTEPVDPGVFAREARLLGEALGGALLLYGPASELIASTSNDADGLRAGVMSRALNDATAAMVERIQHTGLPALSDLFLSPVRPQPMVSLGIAVPRPGVGDLRLQLAFEPAAIQSLLRSVQVPPDMRISIRDRAFHVLASSNPDRQPGPGLSYRWLPERLGDAQHGIFTGPDGSGVSSMVAVERLAMDPGWLILAAQPMAVVEAAEISEIAWPVGAGAVAVLGIVAVVATAQRDDRQRDAQELALLRDAQAQVARLHSGLPAVLILRSVDANGGALRPLFRGGDIEDVIGWPPDSLGDDPIGDLAEAPQDLRRFRSDIVRDGASSVDLRILQPDGGWRWVRVRGQRLEALPDGGAVTVGYIVDISAERAAQIQAQAAARLASMTDMAHGLAHELKQPLQVAMLNADAAHILSGQLRENRVEPAFQADTLVALDEALERCIGQISRTGRLIEHLRRFARGPVEGATSEPIRLAEVVEDTLVLIGHGLKGLGIHVECQFSGRSPVVMGERIALEQILINLLNNARDALAHRPAESARTIFISSQLAAGDTECVLLHVSDTAGGIPDHILGRVFEPLVTTKGVESGTGLGLAISRGLARDMGGDLTVRNGNDGAIFTVRLLVAS